MLKMIKPLVIACVVFCSAFYLHLAHANKKGSLKTMLITLTIEDDIFTAEIEDSPIGHDFISLLPITLTLNDYASTEKVANLPKRLTTQNAANGYKPYIGDITYYAPWGNLAIFYKDFSEPKGLVKIGTIHGSIDPLLRDTPFKVKIDRPRD